MFFGCNANEWANVSPFVTPMTKVRDYSGISPAWPTEPAGTSALLSVRNNPDGIIVGEFDAEYTAMLQTAPPNSLLTAWHEANHAPTFPASTAVAIHEHMYRLVHDTTPNVTYGVITTQWVPSQPGGLKAWFPAAEFLDWVGVDLYDLGGTTDPVRTLERSFAQMPDLAKVVAETNSPVASRRPDWFADVYGWLAANNGADMLTFWSPHGKQSGPFDPGDARTTTALNTIAAEAVAQ